MSLSHWLLAAPLTLALLLVAILSAVTAAKGRLGTLDRAGRLGVRSTAALRSPTAFVLANRVAWPVVAGAAVVAGVCAVLTLISVPSPGTALITFAVGLIGSTTLLIKGGAMGDRAAQTVPPLAPKPGGGSCGGCACGTGGCAGLTRTVPADQASAGT